MIVLLGATGYVGSAFSQLLQQKSIASIGVSRSQVDYTDADRLHQFLKETNASFLINCAGYTGKPNVDACEKDKAECLFGNAVLAGRVRQACERAGIPWGHVSSGCIFTGRRADGEGFHEVDAPNFSFRTDNCSFYSGTKALGEEILSDCDSCYVWRLRIPFNEHDSPRNYITKLLRYRRLLDAENSLSQLQDFVSASLECWLRRVPYGIYNVTNTGSVTTREVVAMMQKNMCPDQSFDFFETEEEFMAIAAKTPRSNCVLDNSKIRATGIPIRSVHEALEWSMRNWVPEPTK
jgi:dTDP-4-dehydrorhamnose reductase